jgi:hypothetical protein
MAASANLVISESGICAIALEMMAEGAIRPEFRVRVQARLRIHMFGVGEIEHDWLLALIARKRQQIFTAGRRKHRMALHADLLLYVLIKVILMARRTLIVPGTLKNDRASFVRHMASVTIKPNLLRVVVVQVERNLRLRSGLHLRLGLRRRCLAFRGRFLITRRGANPQTQGRKANGG